MSEPPAALKSWQEMRERTVTVVIEGSELPGRTCRPDPDGRGNPICARVPPSHLTWSAAADGPG